MSTVSESGELRMVWRDYVSPEPMSGCWLWTGAINQSGYGLIQTSSRGGVKRRQLRVHRVVYEELVGPIPHGLTIDHLCRVRCCINPDHMEPVTAAENTLRGNGPTAQNKRKTHCKRGHALEGSNIIWKNQMRTCRTCKYADTAMRARARRARERSGRA